MAEIITKNGRNWFAEKSIGDHREILAYLAVGNGTSTASVDDTSLDNKLYETHVSNTNGEIIKTSNTGEIRCNITVSGGTEVPGGSDISEVGLFSDRTKTLVYREDRSNPITLQDGDAKTFEWTITVKND